jgi:hypothetical protein
MVEIYGLKQSRMHSAREHRGHTKLRQLANVLANEQLGSVVLGLVP